MLDAETLDPAPFPAEEFEPPRIKQELFASVLEVNTGICGSVVEAVDELAVLRADAKGRAAGAGLALAAAGTWPRAVPEEQAITEDEGYRRFVEFAGSIRTAPVLLGPACPHRRREPGGLHGRARGGPSWLPLVLALSANSPFLAGRESGLASTRAEILAFLPRAGAPPVFSSYEEWESFAERLVALGLADEVTRIWWDIRPHPRYGTLEVRMPDQPTRLEATADLAELVHALVRTAAAVGLRPTAAPTPKTAGRRSGSGALRSSSTPTENGWRASRLARRADGAPWGAGRRSGSRARPGRRAAPPREGGGRARPCAERLVALT